MFILYIIFQKNIFRIISIYFYFLYVRHIYFILVDFRIRKSMNLMKSPLFILYLIIRQFQIKKPNSIEIINYINFFEKRKLINSESEENHTSDFRMKFH